MRDSLLTFQRELVQLRSYLSLMDQLISFGGTSTTSSCSTEAANLAKQIQAFGSRGLQTSFDGALLRLAADFEQLVSGMVSDLLAELPDHIARYEDLPQKLRDSNERYTGDALSRRLRYAGVDPPKVVKNLHDCLHGIQPYVINAEVIAVTERNLTSNELADFVGRLGIDHFWEKMGGDPGLQKWAGTADGAHTKRPVQEKLNGFITDRNNVAHRRPSLGSVGPSVIRGYIEYFEALAPALLSLFEQYLHGISMGGAGL